MTRQKNKQSIRNAILNCVPINQRVQAAALLDVLCMIHRAEGASDSAADHLTERMRLAQDQTISQIRTLIRRDQL